MRRNSRRNLARAAAPVIIPSMDLRTPTVTHDNPPPRHWRPRRQALAIAAVTGAVLLATWVGAVDDLSFEVERVAGAGWLAEDIVIRLNEAGSNEPGAALKASATIARMKMTASAQELRDLKVECPAIQVTDATLACRNARITARLGSLGAQTLSGQVVFGRRTGDLTMQLHGLRIGQGSAELHGELRASGWTARAKLQRVSLDRLVSLAHDWQLPLPPLTATGEATLSLTAAGSGAELRQAQVQAQLHEVTANNEEGSIATDKLSLSLRADLTAVGRGWRFQTELQSSSGQAYVQPVFLDFGAHALQARMLGTWDGGDTLTLEHFAVEHHDVTRGQGSATLQLSAAQPLQALRLQLQALKFPGAYTSYLQPLLLDTNFKALQTSGAISGDVVVAAGAPQRIDLLFADVSVDDGRRTLVLEGLNGEWHWLEGAAAVPQSEDDDPVVESVHAPDSTLSLRGGALFNLTLGASELHFNTQGRQFRLLQPARIPLLDGALELESFRIRNAGLPEMAFLLDATLQPISVQQLCKVFGWPEFGGRIGGKFSKLRMRQGVVTLGTALQAQVFDGSVRISDLRLEQPFGQWPRFHSNIELDNLDLELVTQAFSFGRITGRLSGAVNGLQLFNWTPVAFDARLFTPPQDRSRHRISQRAVENIGSIGGGGAGVTAALSSGFLKFFDDFNYDRLGLSCRLENEVCHMEGVAPAPNGGYYLVKGKGLPRIDVIGGARRVDWPRLVSQLIAVTQSQGPVVR